MTISFRGINRNSRSKKKKCPRDDVTRNFRPTRSELQREKRRVNAAERDRDRDRDGLRDERASRARVRETDDRRKKAMAVAEVDASGEMSKHGIGEGAGRRDNENSSQTNRIALGETVR